ncbi:MAG: diguanylate cyclase [Thiobacillus sp.]|nr:diguanylate cyclase [Thiobacillus sp.]MDP3125688.1 diguanylate cyclase [Thiobacillus sp.]
MSTGATREAPPHEKCRLAAFSSMYRSTGKTTRSKTPRLRGYALFALMWLLFSPTSAFAEKVNILVVAIHGVEIGKQEWQPTFEYLQAALPQHEFHLILVSPFDLERINALVARQEIDFVITQPAIYVSLERNFGVSRILTMVQKGGFSEFGSAIITRADSGIHTIKDLRGKTIAGVATLGFGGWLVGYKEMLDHGFDPYKKAKAVTFLGTQPKEIQAVLNGEVDAAVIRTGALESHATEWKINLDDFRILAPKTYPGFPFKVSTPLYPEWAFAKTHQASNKLSKSVALALLSLGSNSEVAAQAGFQEWTFPYDYQPVHDLLKTLRAGPYENYGKVSMRDFADQHTPEVVLFLALACIILLMTAAIYRSNRILSKEKEDKEKAYEVMKQMATHDSLTGLCNRLLFMELLEQMIHGARRKGSSIAILFIDLDGFKEINDRYGHNYGDGVLCQVGNTLKEVTRSNDAIARLGGDEFIVALSDANEIENLHALAERIVERIAHITLPHDAGIKVGASMGVIFGAPGQYSAEELIQISDKLMYEAKVAGKGRCIIKPIPPRA